MPMENALSGKDLFVGFNEPSDPGNLSDLEKRHVPVIRAPGALKKGECFEVAIEVGGMLAHPNEPRHFIQFIEVYADETFLARVDFTPVRTCPTVTLSLALAGAAEELLAYAYCNLHGMWVGRKPIALSE